MRRRDRPLDVFRQMKLVRSAKDLAFDEDSASQRRASASPDSIPAAAPKKKKLNIPVGDVVMDPEYDSFLSANYSIPTGYVRHSKKINDDSDPIDDYYCDDEDEEWIQSKIATGDKYDYGDFLTVDTLETAINVFEKQTGFGDIINMINAEKALQQVLHIPPGLYSKIVSDIYHYWVSKRNKHHKPCMRKFWPLTSATDTNPHMVFRPREKERYRLRKHRKNDLDSYRKLQQLRREFGQAQVILQLVIERERLKKADLQVQCEIIEQTIYEIENPNATSTRVPAEKLFTFTPKYLHLLQTEQAVTIGKKKSIDGNKAARNNRALNEFGEVEKGKPGRKSLGGDLKRKRISGIGAAPDATDLVSMIEGTGDVVITSESAPPLFANELLSGHALYEANSNRLITLGVPGPPAFLNPTWPNFMDEMPTREKLWIPNSVSEYADSLVLRSDAPLPSKFRCHGRVGRGGRVIMDRIPIYDDPSENSSRIDTCNKYTYIYPSSLPSIHEQVRFFQAVRDAKEAKRVLVDSDDVNNAVFVEPKNVTSSQGYASGKQIEANSSQTAHLRSGSSAPNHSKIMETYQYSCHPIRELGLVLPPPRILLPVELSRREHEIYNMPDSDDEIIDLPDGYSPGPAFPSVGCSSSAAILAKDIKNRNPAVSYSLKL